MPRDIPLGNGKLLVTFDRYYQIRDIYFPHVGKENQTVGHPSRFGVWVDGQLSWLGPDWQISLKYQEGTMVSQVEAYHPGLQVRLVCSDAVDFYESVYVRKIIVRNLADRERDIRLFLHQDFHLYESDVGDTAAYEPKHKTVTHYKMRRYFLTNCMANGTVGVQHFATGRKEVPGAEGTWRDAEDGRLEAGPITQGAVDSTLGIFLKVPKQGSQEAWYWMVAGEDWFSVNNLNKRVEERLPEYYLSRTDKYWRYWLNQDCINFGDLSRKVMDLYYRSLLVIRTQVDESGAIIAANDSDIATEARDTYAYLWPRDGALVAHALDVAGYPQLTRRFFRLSSQLLTPEGYFLHKYNPDGTLASSWHPWVKDGEPQLPIQEDETALVIWALWHHFERFRDVEFITPLYAPLVKRAANWMAAYRDPVTGLPRASYDLWEERHGVMAFTCAAVYAGLMAASNFTEGFGQAGLTGTYRRAAAEVKAGMDRYLYRQELNRFARMVTFKKNGTLDNVDPTIDASLYAVGCFGVYDPAEERVTRTMQAIRDRLWCKTAVGGIARYENDHYHQVSQDLDNVPGNPWFVCTLWVAQWLIKKATTADQLKEAVPLLEWVADRALASGVLAEQVHPYTNEPLSVSPLTWSHATYVQTVLDYLEKRGSLDLCPTCHNPLRPFRTRKTNQ
ncbi:MAG: glycoside hydrolase family 15 protein [Nitrospirae bacterium]|nr:MAG: glycoside hydrolase family 15 protein [Nitrospirota bacterium]